MASSATDSQGKDKAIRENLIKTGHVDCMISVANNFFYTKSLPCSLWFFNKGKMNELKDKVLFIDARNYYTVVDRTLNEWSEWQLKNMNAIVWLYRGEKDKYEELLNEYRQTLHEYADETQDDEVKATMYGAHDFAETVSDLKSFLKQQRAIAKQEVEKAERKDKKKLQSVWDEKMAGLEEIITVAKEADWLFEKFGDGTYQDVPGLCKVASILEIEEKGWSLTPGAYVGVPPVEDDGVDFEERMKEIHKELVELQAESNDLMDTISKNLEKMGL